MNFLTYFRAFSYAMIAVAMLALMFAGGLSTGLALVFLVVMIVSWMLENTRWQLPERYGLGIVLLSIPLFYLDWQYQKSLGEPAERLGVTALAHLIVFLSAVKLVQVKKDRDWVFLYLISFFEVLLAAGLSFSPVFLGTLTLYLLCGLCAVTAFEIQKARRSIAFTETRLLVPPDSRVFKKVGRRSWRNPEAARLPVVAVGLLVLIFALALPLFLIAPRSGAAALTRSGGGLSNFIGFSENVTLGQIGTLKQDDGIVMRVRVVDPTPRELRWRGVALDEFTGKAWKKSSQARQSRPINDRGGGLFQFGTAQSVNRLTRQTFFLEPLESPVLFAAPRVVAIQGDLPYVRVDEEESVQSRRRDFERIMYTAVSDLNEPRMDELREDRNPYPLSFYRYLQLPDDLDPRIETLGTAIVLRANASNRYDVAKAIEAHLQTQFAYSLEMKAGGADPLADFLFNVKAGHCEYYSTAMAVLLRKRGMAARVVNGFLPGEYNETAEAYTVRQSDAHSWVEVYFPQTRSWVTFDPTPSAGRTEPLRTGITAQLQKYAEALELLWFQYVVGYDKQEQRTLATSLHNQVFDSVRTFTNVLESVKSYFTGHVLVLAISVLGLALIGFLIFFGKRAWRWVRTGSIRSTEEGRTYSSVQFYERLISLMEQRGLPRDRHLTPLEFAKNLKSSEALLITRAYNRVRFGNQKLSAGEKREVERALGALEEMNRNG